MKIVMFRTGNKFGVEYKGNVYTGKTPEAAISQIGVVAKYVLYDTTRVFETQTKKTEKIDLNVCPVCGQAVTYVRGKKANNRIGVYIIHKDDVVPEGSQEIGDNEVSAEYKKWLLVQFHQKSEKVEINKKEVSVVVPSKTINELEQPKVSLASTINPEPVPEPDVNPLPIADITGLKHNKFAVIKKIREALVQNGWTEDKLNEAGKDLIKNGKDLATILETAGKYVTVIEKGMPIIMTSGIPA